MRRKRFMQSPKTERRLISGALWFVTACVILAILTSCSTYTVNPTQTKTPSTTARQLSQPATNQPLPRPSCTVTAYTLNMRSGAGMSYNVKQILNKGDALQVIERAGDWLKVSTRNSTGFIYSRYCETGE